MAKPRGEPLTKSDMAAYRFEQSQRNIAERQEFARAAKARGMVQVQTRGRDGSTQKVWAAPMSYVAQQFQDHQISAAEQFSRDWETAYRGLKGQSLEPGVDGGGDTHRVHLGIINAQNRLQQCRAYVGDRSWHIAVAIVVHGATATQLKRIDTGLQKQIVKDDMNKALNDLSAFYSGTRRKDRIWAAFEKFAAERDA